MQKVWSIWIGVLFIMLFSCKKDETIGEIAEAQQGIDLSIAYKVDNESLVTNHFNYETQAGYKYSVTNLVYYLSQISLVKSDGSNILLKKFQYVDATVSETNHLILENVPEGNYLGITFNIGLDSLQNRSDMLPATPENINMQWPEPMGGGYHFLRLEGHYKDSSGTFGYAMHLGTNACLIPIKMNKRIAVSANKLTSVNLVMNINEWFRNPYTFDFNTDGNYIMGNPAAMKKIAVNGTDVFNF